METGNLDHLTKLNELRSSGALTDEEFDAQKRKLLAARSTRWPIFAGVGAVVVIIVVIASAWILQRRPPLRGTLPLATTSRLSAAPTPMATSAPRVTSLTPAERLAQAFEAATGHRRTFAQVVNGEGITVTPVKIVDLPFGPALLVKREIKDGCHACSGFLGVYYLREDHGQTIVTASFPEAVPGWGWGAAPEDWQITERFTANPSIYASGGYTGQGITESSATITELQSAGPVTSDIIGTGYSDAGAITDDDPRPGCELTSTIANVVADRSFDVVVSGTVSGRDKYVKRGGKFVAMNKRDWGLPCST